VFGVILGTGTGGGVVVHQRLVAGPNAVAGEWGHNPLPWPRDDERPGPACYCGRAGCIETFLAGPAVAREYAAAARIPPGDAAPDVTAIAARAEAGEARAEAILQRFEDRLARGLASIINVLDPHVIVLGGGLSNLTRLYDRVPRFWPDLVFGDRHVATRLVRAAHGDSSGVRGAAWLWTAAEAVGAL
jgi:fructokinase